MDPNANLINLLKLAMDEECLPYQGTSEVLADGIVDLVEWLAKGGFAPDWKKALEKARKESK